MNIVVSEVQGRVPITVFKIEGEINVTADEQLQAQALQAHEAGTQNLILDLSQVKYISSSGLRALHHIFMMLRTNDPAESDEAMSKGLGDGTFTSPHLKLVNPSPFVREVLNTSGFDMFLEIHPDLKSAVASF